MSTNSKDFVLFRRLLIEEGRTSLTIAHRLSTVQHRDWRLHFDEGRVDVRKINHEQVEVLPKEALA